MVAWLHAGEDRFALERERARWVATPTLRRPEPYLGAADKAGDPFEVLVGKLLPRSARTLANPENEQLSHAPARQRIRVRRDTPSTRAARETLPRSRARTNSA